MLQDRDGGNTPAGRIPVAYVTRNKEFFNHCQPGSTASTSPLAAGSAYQPADRSGATSFMN